MEVLEQEDFFLHDLALRTAQADGGRRLRVHHQDLHARADVLQHEVDSRLHQLGEIHFEDFLKAPSGKNSNW